MAAVIVNDDPSAQSVFQPVQLALIENLRRVGARIAEDRVDRNLADVWADKIVEIAERDAKNLILVIADMAMPGLDGPQLIAKIKDISPQTPAILISSKVRIYDHDSQADVFLTKGMYAPVDLLERVRLLLVRKRGPKRLQQQQQRPQQIARQIGAA